MSTISLPLDVLLREDYFVDIDTRLALDKALNVHQRRPVKAEAISKLLTSLLEKRLPSIPIKSFRSKELPPVLGTWSHLVICSFVLVSQKPIFSAFMKFLQDHHWKVYVFDNQAIAFRNGYTVTFDESDRITLRHGRLETQVLPDTEYFKLYNLIRQTQAWEYIFILVFLFLLRNKIRLTMLIVAVCSWIIVESCHSRYLSR